MGLGHNEEEDRRCIVGCTISFELLFVVYVERITQDDRDIYRIISARPANRKEANLYERVLSR
ncbi:MAG: BrnT family toxin [Synergistaceae bacterium]|nr:BrnT family toxin [Synergistaceae bacterium]